MLDRWRSCPGLPNNTSNKSKAKEGHQLSHGGPSNRQKNDIKNCVTRYVVPSLVNFKIKWQAKTTGPKYRQYLSFRKKGNILGLGHFLYTCECDDKRACYLIIKKQKQNM